VGVCTVVNFGKERGGNVLLCRREVGVCTVVYFGKERGGSLFCYVGEKMESALLCILGRREVGVLCGLHA
jgi:hypothetical protein